MECSRGWASHAHQACPLFVWKTQSLMQNLLCCIMACALWPKGMVGNLQVIFEILLQLLNQKVTLLIFHSILKCSF